jgi:hypothetical protein
LGDHISRGATLLFTDSEPDPTDGPFSDNTSNSTDTTAPFTDSEPKSHECNPAFHRSAKSNLFLAYYLGLR